MKISSGTTRVRPRGPSVPRRVSRSQIEGFYREFFRPLVRRAIRRHGLSNEDARDVVQETFVRALMKMPSCENAELWLRQVVDYLSVNLQRTVRRRADLLARWGQVEETVSAVDLTVSEEEF